SNPKQAAKLKQARAPADYPQIVISILGRPEQQAHTSTPTFGLGIASNCDCILPVQCPVLVSYQYLPEIWLKKNPARPLLHVEARRANNKHYPRFGFMWVRGFTVTESSKPPAPNQGQPPIIEDLLR